MGYQMNFPINETVTDLLKQRLNALENHFNADVIMYYGAFYQTSENLFLRIIEELAEEPKEHKNLVILLTSPGGSAETVERLVNIVRHHYSIVDFVVPDYAYSAGTIFCMSGDSIHMDYFSVLGPIDPQVQNKDGRWVPALGYLDKVDELITKSQTQGLSTAEYTLLRQIDLAELRAFEQARDLTIELLKKWLCQYKFKNWNTHRTNPALIGQQVTMAQKEARAEEIAHNLSDNGKWNSHGRPLNISRLNELKLAIDDYTNDSVKRKLIRDYYFLAIDYIQNNNYKFFVHTRKFL
jgi:membrane-bound ClpP family serine protease